MSRRIIATVNGARVVIQVPDNQDAEILYQWIDGGLLMVHQIQEQEWRTV